MTWRGEHEDESTRRQRVLKMAARASSVDPVQRSAFLDSACGEDAALPREVKALLPLPNGSVYVALVDGRSEAAPRPTPSTGVAPAVRASDDICAVICGFQTTEL